MTRQIIIPSPPVDRRQPLLDGQDASSRGRPRLGEVAGGTAAACAAVCCCCPCGIVNLLVLTVYKLPAGLCRRALRRKRRLRAKKNGMLQPRQCGFDNDDLQSRSATVESPLPSPETDKDVLELEKEMWDRFYRTGFWRSPSQKSDP